MKRKILSIVLILATLLCTFGVTASAAKEPFKDVVSGDWYSQYVIYVYENELMNGMSETKFDPNGTCTRAMAATVLYRIAGSPSVSDSASFKDLTASWYKEAVAWAEKEKVVNGVGGGKFAPNGLVTREQLLTMIWRFAGEPAPKKSDNLSKFSDAKKVSSYAKAAFNWGIENEIINGKDGKLAPNGDATRAEFAKIITVVDETGICCEHEWEEIAVIASATCTENGEATYTCKKCELTQNKTIKALEHDYSQIETIKQPTCTEDGEEKRTCFRCGDVRTEEISALKHDYSQTEVIKQVTCTENGEEKRICSRCGDTHTDTIKSTGHDWVDATCTEAKYCTKCGETAGTALGHTTYNGVCHRCNETISILGSCSLTVTELPCTTEYHKYLSGLSPYQCGSYSIDDITHEFRTAGNGRVTLRVEVYGFCEYLLDEDKASYIKAVISNSSNKKTDESIFWAYEGESFKITLYFNDILPGDYTLTFEDIYEY